MTMFDAKLIADLARQLTEALPPQARALHAEVSKSFEAVLATQLQKLDLVTRSEFDAQSRVLARTREKLDALEKRLNDIG
jgi:hypothetical protein